jgi:D-glycero-D-manno-heptose 1,7-bisphosphate phosphatase
MNVQAADTIRSLASHGRAAVFLDRDGVLVRAEMRDGKSHAVRRLEDFRLLPGASEAVRALHDHGFLIVAVTNQPDIGNGLVTAEVLCPHRQADNCACRKPKAGMLTAAAARFSIDFSASFMVGDRCSDIVAGRAVGCYTVFVDRGYDRCTDVKPDAVVRSLRQAVQHILSRTVPPGRNSPK